MFNALAAWEDLYNVNQCKADDDTRKRINKADGKDDK